VKLVHEPGYPAVRLRGHEPGVESFDP
jgi:hypothetical protein